MDRINHQLLTDQTPVAFLPDNKRNLQGTLSHAYPSTDQHLSKRPAIWADGVFLFKVAIYLSKLQALQTEPTQWCVCHSAVGSNPKMLHNSNYHYNAGCRITITPQSCPVIVNSFWGKINRQLLTELTPETALSGLVSRLLDLHH